MDNVFFIKMVENKAPSCSTEGERSEKRELKNEKSHLDDNSSLFTSHSSLSSPPLGEVGRGLWFFT